MRREEAIEELKGYIVGSLEDYKGTSAEDLHFNLFNTDYYIIGTYQATQWLGSDVFDVIEEIKEYEMNNFGSVNTDFSNAEAVVNMYTYILGEEILSQFDLSGELDAEKIEEIKSALS